MRSGVNWMRLKEPPRTSARVLMVSVLASPGTPSSRMWPPAKRPTRMRSSIASWPTMIAPDLEQDGFADRVRVGGIGEGAQVARGLGRGGLGHGGSSHVGVGWVGWLGSIPGTPLSRPFLKAR